MSEPVDRAASEIRQLVGVYHADGSLWGELVYVIGKLAGRTHCALCDLTHRGVRRRPEFDACVAALPVPFRLVHLDERDADVAAASEGNTPCVLADTEGGLIVVLEADDLERCEGDPDRLRRAIDGAVTERGLVWAR